MCMVAMGLCKVPTGPCRDPTGCVSHGAPRVAKGHGAMPPAQPFSGMTLPCQDAWVPWGGVGRTRDISPCLLT